MSPDGLSPTNPGATIAPRPQLLTYPDSLGGTLSELGGLLTGRLSGLFRGVHILPPFPSTADRGFAPVTYDVVDPSFGTWDDIERLAETHDVVLDVMVNHLSRESEQFRDFRRRGRRSPSADLFVTVDKVWPTAAPTGEDLARIFLRKPDSPFSSVTIEETGDVEQVWTSFGTGEWSEQVDLDVTSDAGRDLITSWLGALASHGVRIVRLDAVGYVTKRAGTSCFMVDPDIYEFLDWIEEVAAGMGLVLLPEVHDHDATRRRLAARGHWTYDFVMPGLLLNTFHRGRVDALARHLVSSPSRQFTVLDCHDGIPVLPDLDGVLPVEELRALSDRTVARGGNVNRILSSLAPGELDVHQLNCTYYSALARDDDRYLAARAVQLFARGVPQIYYVGLLAGGNDHTAIERTSEGRAVNRHDYSIAEVDMALETPLVKRIVELVALRNTHPAFDGVLSVEATSSSRLQLSWTNAAACCALFVDAATGEIEIDERTG